MLAAIRSEFLKLFTVRSTYLISIFVALFIMLFAGYIDGFKTPSAGLQNPGFLASEVTNALTLGGVFCGLIAILMFSHEYRYNTIMHTLTNINSRSKALLAKILVMSGFAGVFAVLTGAFSPLCAYIGVHLAGHSLAAQSIPFSDLLWRGLFFTWGYAMIGLVLVALARNQTFSVVALFFIPITVEQIASLLLKQNAVYLPFSALNNVLTNNADLTHLKASLVFSVYIVSLWITAWLLFLRRDAN